MFELSERTKRDIADSLQLPFEDVLRLTPDEELAHIRKITGKPVKYNLNTGDIHISRGNPYIAIGQVTLPEDMERQLKAIR